MGKLTTLDIVLSVLYASAAILLLITAYRIYLKRFKRAKLQALNAINLITSKDNIFKSPTKFLIEAPLKGQVKIELLDRDENLVKTLIDIDLPQEEFPFDFDPTEFEPGKYYLYLTTDNAKIQRGISIVRD